METGPRFEPELVWVDLALLPQPGHGVQPVGPVELEDLVLTLSTADDSAVLDVAPALSMASLLSRQGIVDSMSK